MTAASLLLSMFSVILGLAYRQPNCRGGAGKSSFCGYSLYQPFKAFLVG
jgi:hypothetical protein